MPRQYCETGHGHLLQVFTYKLFDHLLTPDYSISEFEITTLNNVSESISSLYK